MKQKKGPLILLTVITIFIFKNNLIIQKSILESCNLFITKIFPSLFPMMILSDCFIYFGLPDILCQYFGYFFTKLFHTSPYGAFAFLISCFSGTPSNVYVIKRLYLNNYLSKNEAEKILGFAFFSNPLFLFTMLSLIFKNHNSSVLKIIIIPYIVNIFLGIINKNKTIDVHHFLEKKQVNFGIMITDSIKRAMNTQLFILGSICLFFLINNIINPQNLSFISGILEISQGLNSLIPLNLSFKIKELLAIIYISFGGLSIHLQINGIINDTDLSYTNFLKFRIYQTIISIIIILLF